LDLGGYLGDGGSAAMVVDCIGDAEFHGGLKCHGLDECECAVPELKLSFEQGLLISAVLLLDGPHAAMFPRFVSLSVMAALWLDVEKHVRYSSIYRLVVFTLKLRVITIISLFFLKQQFLMIENKCNAAVVGGINVLRSTC
jgi:hypothetical protein